MPRSVEEITKELTRLNQSSLDNSINTLNQTAESDRNIINTNADVSVSNITDAYNTQIADVNEGYNEAFNRNEVQKVLNERYLERKAAEIGLTDSGMNRTQLTANQLSPANQQGRLDAALQKDVNTLAAAMRAKITEVNTNRNNSLAQIDSTLNSNIAQLRSDFNSSINQQAVDIHNTEYKAEQEAINTSKSNWLTNYNSLLKGIINEDVSQDEKLNAIDAFGATYRFESIEQANAALNYAGLGKLYYYDAKGKLQKTEEKSKADADADADAEYYTTEGGNRRYHFVIDEATWNFGGVDDDDVITIYYGKRENDKQKSDKAVATKIKISQLPDITVTDPVDGKEKSLKQAITDRTARKKKGDTFYFTTDLGDWTIPKE